MRLGGRQSKYVIINIAISLIMAFIAISLLDKYIYRISFAFYYSYFYEVVFLYLTIIGGLGCLIGALLSRRIFVLSCYLLMLPLFVVFLKLVSNSASLVMYGTQQESFDLLITMTFLIVIITFLNSLRVINKIVMGPIRHAP